MKDTSLGSKIDVYNSTAFMSLKSKLVFFFCFMKSLVSYYLENQGGLHIYEQKGCNSC